MSHQSLFKLVNELLSSVLVDTTLVGLISSTAWRWARRYWPKKRRQVRKRRSRR